VPERTPRQQLKWRRTRRFNRIPPTNPGRPYEKLWRLVDGAVKQTFDHHPEYLAQGKRPDMVRRSINKRVVGALMGFVAQSTGNRSS
jgi:hypothetical protein